MTGDMLETPMIVAIFFTLDTAGKIALALRPGGTEDLGMRKEQRLHVFTACH